MNKFLVTQQTVRVINIADDLIQETLPTAIYAIRYDQLQGFYLENTGSSFEVPSKLYGKTDSHTSRFVNTFNMKSGTTGILLTGDKGSGKSLTAKITCNKLLKQNIPVVCVSEPYQGAAFNSFIESLGTCALFFDEFGKIYKDNDAEITSDGQNNLLSLFDGYSSVKRLIILTENKIYDINEYLKQRPGRALYHLHFDKLELDVVKEYCKEYNLPQKEINYICNICKDNREFSMDILKAIVDEYLRYNEPISNFIDILNIPSPTDKIVIEPISMIVNDLPFYPYKESITIDIHNICFRVRYGKDQKEADNEEHARSWAFYENTTIDEENGFIYLTCDKAILKAKIIQESNPYKFIESKYAF